MKKTIYILVVLLSSAFVFAQNEVIKYTDSIGKEATETNFYNKSVFSFQDSCKCYVITTFNAKNIPTKSVCYEDADTRIVHGQYVVYDSKGRLDYANTYNKNSMEGPFRRWYENGKLCEKGIYIKSDETIGSNYKIQSFWDRDGIQTVKEGNGFYLFENEFGIDQGVYKDGVKTGKWTGLFGKKMNSYEEFYDNGTLVEGTATTPEGKKINYTKSEIRPEPLKGINHFYKYIGSNFEPTAEALKEKIKGTLILYFIVEKTGEINGVRVSKSLGYGLDEEAVRLLYAYPKWKPGLQKGLPVRTSYQIPIRLDFTTGY